MKQQQIKKLFTLSIQSPDFNKSGLELEKAKKAFTLVELIIVITILAILATIAFVSFSGYSKNSRDANRFATLGNIEKGLALHYVQTSSYPSPESIYLTGTFNNVILTKVGFIQDNISSLIKLTKNPTDPQTSTNYIYATSPNNKHFQIGSILEGSSQISQSIASAHANNIQAYVVGDYRGLLTYDGYIYNLPSLLISGTGNLSVTSYIINKGRNIPYSSSQVINNNQSVFEVYLQLGSRVSTLTGIVLPGDKDTFLSNSDEFKDSLGYDIDTIGREIFGNQYFIGGNSFSKIPLPPVGTIGNISYNSDIYSTKVMPMIKSDNTEYSAMWTTQNLRHSVIVGGNDCLTTSWTSTDTGKCSVGNQSNSVVGYNDTSVQTNNFGMYYQWSAAIEACKLLGRGWYLPTNEQFKDLERGLGCSNGDAGGVDTVDTWNRCGDGYGGFSTWARGLGYNANLTEEVRYLGGVFGDNTTSLSGRRNLSGSFGERGSYGRWWSATMRDSTQVFARYLYNSNSTLSVYSYSPAFGYSVVCIKE